MITFIASEIRSSALSTSSKIDGQAVPVKAGDHVFTPLDVFHGIENTSSKENLKVFLTYIERS